MRISPTITVLALLVLAAGRALTAQTAAEIALEARAAAAVADRAELHRLALLQIEGEEFGDALQTLADLEVLCPQSLGVANNQAVAVAADGDYDAALDGLTRLASRAAGSRTAAAAAIRANRGTVAKLKQLGDDRRPVPALDAVELVLVEEIDDCLPAAPAEPLSVVETVEAPGPEAIDESAPPGAEETTDDQESDARDAIAVAVLDWADAWQEQRVDDYLGAYSQRFRPADGSSRADWERVRRARVAEPASIRVIIGSDPDEPEFEEVKLLSDTQGEARFRQQYESDRFRDSVIKRLSFVLEDGRWKILAEIVEP